MIACVLIPTFAAALERRDDQALARHPLILAERQRVYAVSDEVAENGVVPGMGLNAARARCPQARVVTARPNRYQAALEKLLDLLTGFSLKVEPEEGFQQATCYVEMETSVRARAIETIREIGRTVRQKAGLPPALGAAGGKFPAHVAAASVLPNRALFVAPGREARLLSPLPVETLPMDGEMLQRLHRLGIRTLGQFAALPAGAVLTQFGREGERLHRLARGQDERPVRPRLSRPTEQAAYRFESPITDRAILKATVERLAQALGNALQEQCGEARTLWLALRLEDGTTRERRRRLYRPLSDTGSVKRGLEGLLKQMWIHCGIIEITALATDLTPREQAARQLDLFAPQSGQRHRLQEALPLLIARYGAGCFYHISITDPEAPLLERRFHLRPGKPS